MREIIKRFDRHGAFELNDPELLEAVSGADVVAVNSVCTHSASNDICASANGSCQEADSNAYCATPNVQCPAQSHLADGACAQVNGLCA